MIEGKFISGNGDLTEPLALRTEVFVHELGLPGGLEQDGLDPVSVHAVVYENGKPVGTGRIMYDGERCVISRLAVIKSCRGKGYGDFLTRLLVNQALETPAGSIVLTAGQDSARLFERIGFLRKAGDGNEIRMKLQPQLLQTCSGCRRGGSCEEDGTGEHTLQ